MQATTNPSLGRPPLAEPEARTLSFERQALQKISTATSLISLALGFSVLGTLTILNRHQADLNGFAGGSSLAMIGGISSILVGATFLVTGWLYAKFCARRAAAFSVNQDVTPSPSSRPK